MWPIWKSLFYAMVSSRYRYYRSNYLVTIAEVVAAEKSVPKSLIISSIVLGHRFFVEGKDGGPPVLDCRKLSATMLASWVQINLGVMAAIFEHSRDFDPSQLPGITRIYYDKCGNTCSLNCKFDLAHYGAYIAELMIEQAGELKPQALLLLDVSFALGEAGLLAREHFQLLD